MNIIEDNCYQISLLCLSLWHHLLFETIYHTAERGSETKIQILIDSVFFVVVVFVFFTESPTK